MRIPFLKNFRRGFATNSSSSHSFVYLKRPTAGLMGQTPEENSFQWEDFRLDTLKEKLFYALVSKIGGGWGSTPTDEEVENAYNDYSEEFPEFDRADFAHALAGSIDHDSIGIITAAEARDPHVVIFGGNDNGDGSRERAAVVAAEAVDWDKTGRPSWEDEASLSPTDVRGHQLLRGED